MSEIRISVKVDLVEGVERQWVKHDVSIHHEPETAAEKATTAPVVDYAALDHALRKMDDMLDELKKQLRTTSRSIVRAKEMPNSFTTDWEAAPELDLLDVAEGAVVKNRRKGDRKETEGEQQI